MSATLMADDVLVFSGSDVVTLLSATAVGG